MAASDFAINILALMFFVVGALVIFGGQQNSDFLSIWSNSTYTTTGLIGNTDINTSLSGSPSANVAPTSITEGNNIFLNVLSELNILPKILHALESAGNAFANVFSFLPEGIRWGIGLPLLALISVGLVSYLLNATGISKGGGA